MTRLIPIPFNSEQRPRTFGPEAASSRAALHTPAQCTSDTAHVQPPQSVHVPQGPTGVE